MLYRPEIEGLRALAVIPVILFHAGFGIFSRGYLGVDVFFVISGYLITQLIVTDIDSGGFRLTHFYERRIRRLLPALFVVVLTCIPFSWFLLEAPDLRDFAQSLIAVATFTSNILFSIETNYFQANAELKPLLHTWSLAVEEQFYLVFPLVLLGLLAFARKRFFIVLLIILIISSFLALCQGAVRSSSNFYFLHTRAWELLLGATVGVYMLSRNEDDRRLGIHYQVLSLLGLFLTISPFFGFYDALLPRRLMFIYAFIPVVGTALILVFSIKGTLVQRLLVNPVLIGIGLISYSLYLWHQPIFAFAKYWSFSDLSLRTFVVLIPLTFLLSFFTWRFVETPMRQRNFLSSKAIFLSAAFLSLSIISIGVLGHIKNGFPNREVIGRYSVLEYQPNNRLLQI